MLARRAHALPPQELLPKANCAVAFALFLSLVAHAPEAHAQDAGPMAIRAEATVGSTLAPYPPDPVQSGGSGLAGGLHVRAAYSLLGPVAAQASLGVDGIAGPAHPSGMPSATLGLRLDVPLGSASSLGVDASGGLGLPTLDPRFVLDLGVSVEFVVTRAISLGPTLRYGQVVVPVDLGSDGRFWTFGVIVALHGMLPASAHTHGDLDNDGILDEYDRCPTVPTTAEGDRDHDGCPDGPDEGLAHAPLRAEIPSVVSARAPGVTTVGVRAADAAQPPMAAIGTPTPGDRDGDGIPDDRDRCPDQPETINGFQDNDGCPEDMAPLAELDGDQIRLTEQLTFASDSDRIVRLASFQTLEAVAALLGRHPEITHLEVQGHTDSHGSRHGNAVLSQRRAQSVTQFLQTQGVAGARLVAQGYGPDMPVADNDTPEGRAHNRRVALHLLDGVRFPAAGPLPVQDATDDFVPHGRHRHHHRQPKADDRYGTAGEGAYRHHHRRRHVDAVADAFFGQS